MVFSLSEGGSLDTVIVCDACGQEEHFNYDGTIEATAEEIEACYLAWVEGLCAGAAVIHKC